MYYEFVNTTDDAEITVDEYLLRQIILDEETQIRVDEEAAEWLVEEKVEWHTQYSEPDEDDIHSTMTVIYPKPKCYKIVKDGHYFGVLIKVVNDRGSIVYLKFGILFIDGTTAGDIKSHTVKRLPNGILTQSGTFLLRKKSDYEPNDDDMSIDEHIFLVDKLLEEYDMEDNYYKPCVEFDICNELIENYFKTEQYEKCFKGHLELALRGYPLAECQVGYFYFDGLGVEKDIPMAVYWTQRAAEHGDRDGQYNLAWFYEESIGVEPNIDQAIYWYRQAALQGHDLAIAKCKAFGVDLD